MIICGIDPGITGGLTFIQDNETHVVCERVPTVTYKINGKNKKFLDLVKIVNRLDLYKPYKVFIEKQQSMPKQGVASTFKTGFNYGIYIGAFVALGLDYKEVIPRQWKKDLGLKTSSKDEAREKASELIPYASDSWKLKCEDGVAESALIAYWGLYYSQTP